MAAVPGCRRDGRFPPVVAVHARRGPLQPGLLRRRTPRGNGVPSSFRRRASGLAGAPPRQARGLGRLGTFPARARGPRVARGAGGRRGASVSGGGSRRSGEGRRQAGAGRAREERGHCAAAGVIAAADAGLRLGVGRPGVHAAAAPRARPGPREGHARRCPGDPVLVPNAERNLGRCDANEFRWVQGLPAQQHANTFPAGLGSASGFGKPPAPGGRPRRALLRTPPGRFRSEGGAAEGGGPAAPYGEPTGSCCVANRAQTSSNHAKE